MKAKTHRPEQIVKLLREVAAAQTAGKTVEPACRDLGISDRMYPRWKGQHGGMQTDEVKRLKRIVAELTLDKQILTEAARGN
jgi:hypothetical protein